YVIERDILHLEWLVNERNSVFAYQVQKMIDHSWEEIAQVASINGTIRYSDLQIENDYSYYRLCARNLDQAETCFPVITVSSGQVSDFIIYPNPILSDQVLHIAGSESVYKIELFSMDGNVSTPGF